jgi:hypothetical protein
MKENNADSQETPYLATFKCCTKLNITTIIIMENIVKTDNLDP